MWVDGRLSLKDLGGYTLAQCVGGIVGCLPMALVEGGDCGFGANALVSGASNPVVVSFAVEAILTFVFVFVVLGATDKAESSTVAGIVIGLSLVLVHLVGIHYTGTSVNPARSLGPAIFAGGNALAALPVFIVGPYVGGVLAAFCYRYVAGKDE
jgi:aquaporin Z